MDPPKEQTIEQPTNEQTRSHTKQTQSRAKRVQAMEKLKEKDHEIDTMIDDIEKDIKSLTNF